MPVIKTNIHEFIKQGQTHPVLDVRSPAEFEHAHIPGAFSFPIFSNQERKEIGTAYKQLSRETAIKIGLQVFGKNLLTFVENADVLSQNKNSSTKTVAVHCWRGGMRSSAMAWLLDLYGYKVYLLEGGYKAYRNWVLEQFNTSYNLNIVSGFTGSNKTGTLNTLSDSVPTVIDLEGLANHRGSAFGHIGLNPQPSQEQFENLLAMELNRMHSNFPESSIWIEDESQRIGLVNLPSPFFSQMREQKILFLDIPYEKRLDFLVSTYGKFEKSELLKGIERISKKLGGLEFRTANDLLEKGDVKSCFRILLNYYDRLYLKSSLKRGSVETKIFQIHTQNCEAKTNAEILLNYVDSRIAV